MGQYYNILVGDMPISEKTTYKVYDRSVDTQYTMAKLTEFSWFGNPFCDALANELLNPKIVIWCGDYAENSDLEKIPYCQYKHITVDKIWDSANYETIAKKEFDWSNKYILNLSKSEFINVNKYWNNSVITIDEEPWVLNPIAILTAVGNGRGGGDYFGSDMDHVGRWAGDVIVISEKYPPELLGTTFSELDVTFKEKAYCECE